MRKPPISQIAGGVILASLSAALIIIQTFSPLTSADEIPPETSSAVTETTPADDFSASIDLSASPESGEPAQLPEPVDMESLAAWFASIPSDPAVPLGEMTTEILSTIPDDILRELVFISSSVSDPDASQIRKAFYDTVGMTPLAYMDAIRENQDIALSASGNDGGNIGNLVFTGDFNLGEDFTWCPVSHLAEDAQVSDFLLSPLDVLLSTADVCCINLECTISERGTPTPDKLYTFRGKPENLRLLNEIGCDIVSLANNHVHDYGTDAMLDTITYLDEAGILSVGAGADLTEAMDYESITVNGVKIGFVAASNAEKYRLTPAAAEDTPGILAMYDPEAMYTAVENASRECDYVVCVVHWGTENSTAVNDNQRELAAEFIRLGADAVIGHHPHVLQETQIIDGVPVAYSLGNFWFNTSPNDTAVAEVILSWNDTEIISDLVMHPCKHVNGITYLTEQPSN